GVAVEREHGRADEEEPPGRGLDERGKVGEPVGVAEGAVRTVGGKHIDDGVDIVLRHADRVACKQLLELDDVVDGRSRHGVTLTKVYQASNVTDSSSGMGPFIAMMFAAR